MATKTYSVMTGEGGELGEGMSLGEARKAAQAWADERFEALFIAGPGLRTDGVEQGSDEDIGEQVEPSEVARFVDVVEGSQLGPSATDADVDAYCEWAEEWLTAHEGPYLSIVVRPVRRGEAAGLYEVRANGDLQILGYSLDRPARVVELLDACWEAWCRLPAPENRV